MPENGPDFGKMIDLSILLKYDIQHSVMSLIILNPWRSVLSILQGMDWCLDSSVHYTGNSLRA